jgi:uncharacterized protein YjbJ (UPF0337 family)
MTNIQELTFAELSPNWDTTRTKLKQKFGILTDFDLVLKEGQLDKMIDRLQITLGKTKAEMHKIIFDFQTT